MRKHRRWFILAVAATMGTTAAFREPPARARVDPPTAQPAEDNDRAHEPDSYFYYGPNGLWKDWHDDPAKNPNGPVERLGRDTWIHWTWGNQKFLRKASVLAGH